MGHKCVLECILDQGAAVADQGNSADNDEEGNPSKMTFEDAVEMKWSVLGLNW